MFFTENASRDQIGAKCAGSEELGENFRPNYTPAPDQTVAASALDW